jgi:glutaredoxin/cytochrome c556
MRSFVIAVVMTALVAGLGYALAPAPRDPAAAEKRAASVLDELADASAGESPADAAASDAAGDALPTSAKRTFFQWTDERGTVRFARSLDEVPPAWRERAGQIEIDTRAYQPKAAPAAGSARRPYSDLAVAQAGTRFADVTVYSAPWCGWCRKTLAWLDERDIDYTNKDIERNEDWADELEEKSGGRSIPFVEIDGTQIRGYNPSEMAALLN